MEKLNEENVKHDRNQKLFREKQKNLEDKIHACEDQITQMTKENTD